MREGEGDEGERMRGGREGERREGGGERREEKGREESGRVRESTTPTVLTFLSG